MHLNHPQLVRPFATSFVVALAGLLGCTDPSGPQPKDRLLAWGRYERWFWSAAGDEIVYTSGYTESGQRSILAVNRSTGATRTIVKSAPDGKFIDPFDVGLSSDGQYVYFYAGPIPLDKFQSRTSDLYRVPVQNPSTPQLLVPGIEYGSAAISPAGDMVAVYVRAGQIILVRWATGERTTLAPPITPNMGQPSIAWSPDGHRLLVSQYAGFSLYDVASSQVTVWDVQLPVSFGKFRWNGDNPVVYAVRRRAVHDRHAASAVRYDVAARAQQELGSIHEELTDEPGHYSWSPDFTKVAWSRSYCTQTSWIVGAPVCMASMYALHATNLISGVTTTVASLSIDDWPDQGGATAFSPNGEHIAFAAGPLGLRVFGASTLP